MSHETIPAFPATHPPPVSCIPPWFSMTGLGTLPRVPGIPTLGPYHGLSPLSLLGPGTPGFPLLNHPFYPGILPPSFSLPISAPLSSASYPLNPVLQSYRPPTMAVSTPTVRARFSPVSTPVQVQSEATAVYKPQAVGGTSKAGGVVTSAKDRILPPRTDLKTILLSRYLKKWEIFTSFFLIILWSFLLSIFKQYDLNKYSSLVDNIILLYRV